MPTSTRHRQTFKYKPDSSIDYDSDDSDAALDDQQQDELIANLTSSDAANNDLYVKVFTCLPLLAILVYLWGLRLRSRRVGSRGKGSAAIGLLALLGVTSLVATAVEMWFVRLKDAPSLPSTGYNDRSGYDGGVARHLSRSRVRRVPFTDLEIDDDGPIGRVLPWLNFGICGLLAFVGVLEALTASSRTTSGDGLWIILLLPGLILGVVTIVMRSVREVEEGIGELGRLRYGYKGA